MRDNNSDHCGISRRHVLQSAGAIGMANTVLSGLLGVARPAQAAAYDPKKYAGTKLNILMIGDENDERALADLLPQFEAETGMKLEITAPALGPLIEKTVQILKADKPSFDLVELSRLPDHAAGRRRLFQPAQRLYRQRRRDAARLGLQGFHPGGGEECRATTT